MPHERARWAADNLKQALKHRPIVGILGQRQVGKTTLAEHIGKEYVTLDLAQELAKSVADPSGFLLDRDHPFVIDECQLAPALFPALKEHVRRYKTPGQFLLTGSVRFTSRKAIRESLTGRIRLIEIHPMTYRELHSLEPSPFFMKLIQGRSLESALHIGARQVADDAILHFLSSGGLPGICFARATKVRSELFEDQLNTLLDRDLRLVIETSLSFVQLRGLLKELALHQGDPVEMAGLARKTRISRTTLPKILHAFESIFLIRKIESRGGLFSPTFFFEDQGIRSHLAYSSGSPTALDVKGIEALAFGQSFAHWSYFASRPFQMQQFRTRGGAHVPVVLDDGNQPIAWVPYEQGEPPPMKTGESFLRAHPKGRVVLIAPNAKATMLSKQMAIVSPSFLV